MKPQPINPMKPDLLAQGLLALLPQTQCKRCGFDDCEAYANSMAHENTPINQCPPGGEEGIMRLAAFAEREPLPLNPSFGLEGPRKMAVIDEQWCIGCTLCLDACPTDAIVGTHKSMHTVIESYCTGCELCVPVCPVDCIELEVSTPGHCGWQAWSTQQAQLAQSRYADHKKRLDEKALRGPKTHTQAKRLQVLNTKELGATGESMAQPMQSLTQAQTTKASLIQKALQKAQQQAALRTPKKDPPPTT